MQFGVADGIRNFSNPGHSIFLICLFSGQLRARFETNFVFLPIHIAMVFRRQTRGLGSKPNYRSCQSILLVRDQLLLLNSPLHVLKRSHCISGEGPTLDALGVDLARLGLGVTVDCHDLVL